MSEQDAMQAELEGMPEKPKDVPRWLHVCEVQAETFGYLMTVLRAIKGVPHMQDGDVELFQRASDRFSELVQLQLGERQWGDAVEDGVALWNEAFQAALARTKRETAEEGETE